MNKLIVVIMFFLISGCGITSNNIEGVQKNNNDKARGGGSAEKWWMCFDDPKLNKLIETMLNVNPDMAISGLKIKQAIIDYELSYRELFPSISSSIGANSNRSLKHHESSKRSSNSSLAFNYEIDVWGRLSAVKDEAQWEVDASIEDREAIRLTLIGKTLELYWQLAYLHLAIQSSQEDFAAVTAMSEIITNRYQVGAASKFDWLQTQHLLSEHLSILSDLKNQERITKSTLNYLLNNEHGNLLIKPQLSDFKTNHIPTSGIPVKLLSRRPDIKAAEYRLLKNHANLTQERANIYPSFNLIGNIAGGAEGVLEFMKNPVGSIGYNIALPFVEWKKRTLLISRSEYAYTLAEVEFKKKLYEAILEADTALANAKDALDLEMQFAIRFDLVTQEEQISKRLYQIGNSSILPWIEQQNRKRNIKMSLLEKRKMRLLSISRLYLSFGGELGINSSTCTNPLPNNI